MNQHESGEFSSDVEVVYLQTRVLLLLLRLLLLQWRNMAMSMCPFLMAEEGTHADSSVSDCR